MNLHSLYLIYRFPLSIFRWCYYFIFIIGWWKWIYADKTIIRNYLFIILFIFSLSYYNLCSIKKKLLVFLVFFYIFFISFLTIKKDFFWPRENILIFLRINCCVIACIFNSLIMIIIIYTRYSPHFICTGIVKRLISLI